METRTHFTPNNDGWILALKQVYDPDKLIKGRRPVVIVPGYGMNAFIFGYHPNGASLEEYIVSRGYEVWSINMRNQGDSINDGGSKEYSMADIVNYDLPAAFDFIVENNISGADKIDPIGCSLGGTYVYAYAALTGADSVFGSMVTMGGPLRWEYVHPVLKFAFGSPRIAGAIPFAGTRKMASIALPLITRYAPTLLHIYMHPEIVDTSHPEELVKTVEDPNRFLNRELAEWIKSVDLYIEGRNITELLSTVKNPLLAIIANADGVVPEETVTAAIRAIGGDVKDALYCGDDEIKMAHADMFISDYSQELVFSPLCDWLDARYAGAKKRAGKSKSA